MEITFCPNCGHQNQPGSRFCEECGCDLIQGTTGAARSADDTANAATETSAGEATSAGATGSTGTAKSTGSQTEHGSTNIFQ